MAIVMIALYFVPTIVALSRDMPNKGSTIAVNVFLGWTLIGWVVALAMALGDPTPRGAQVIVQNNVAPRNLGNPVWDHARQAYLYQDPGTRAWMIQSVDGTWMPLLQDALRQGQPLPPPRQRLP